MISNRVPLPFRIVVAQCIATGVLALLWLLLTPGDALASVLAGVAVIIPNALFAWRVASAGAGANAVDEARRLVGSGIAKSLMGVVLLIAMFVAYRPEPVAFFVTLIGVQAIHWIAPLLDVPRRRDRSADERTRH